MNTQIQWIKTLRNQKISFIFYICFLIIEIYYSIVFHIENYTLDAPVAINVNRFSIECIKCIPFN